MAGFQSAQEFIRALKAPSDPPHAGGPYKVELAQQAWDNASFYIPNKGEVIVDWLLTRLLKDKAKEPSANPVLDTRYWKLLFDIISYTDASKANGHSRALKTWLVPLLNRVPVAPIIVAFFSMSESSGRDGMCSLDVLVSRCLTVLWPMAVPKFSPETLLECFGAVIVHSMNHIDRIVTSADFEKDTMQAQSLVVSSYRTAFSNSANKKKLYSTFLQRDFPAWLQCGQLQADGHESFRTLMSQIYSAGVETIFSPDILRQAGDQKCDAALLERLAEVLSTSTAAVLGSLPHLLTSFIQSIKKHRNTIFGQGSNSVPSDTVSQVQEVGMFFFSLCNQLLGSAGENKQIWDTKNVLFAIIDRENLFNARNEHAEQLLRQNGDLAIEALMSASQEQNMWRTNSALELLSTLTRIDYDLIAPSLSTILKHIISVPEPGPQVLNFLNLILEYHSKTRTINVHISHWLEAFSTRHLQVVSNQAYEVYQIASSGPLLCYAYFDRLEKSIHNFLTPGQITELVDDVLQKIQNAFQQFEELAKKAAADNGDGTKKKRKRAFTSAPSGSGTNPEWAAVTFALLSRATILVLTSLPLHLVLEDVRRNVYRSIEASCSSIIPQALKGAFKVLGTNDFTSSRGWQTVGNAALRVLYGLEAAPQLQLRIRCDDDLYPEMLTKVTLDETLPEFSLEMMRTLLKASAEDELSPTSVFDQLLTYLDRHLKKNNVGWSGKSHHLGLNTSAQAAIAMTHLLFTRWLPFFDSRASSEQLARLANLVLNYDLGHSLAHLSAQVKHEVTIPMIFTGALRNAAFWELHRFRDAFLAQLHERTTFLEHIDQRLMLSDLSNRLAGAITEDINRVGPIYEILLHTPSEYLSRGLRTDFLRRALAADVSLGMPSLHGGEMLSNSKAQMILLIREFLRRTFLYLGTVDQTVPKQYLEYIMEPLPVASLMGQSIIPDLESITVDIIGIYFVSVLKFAQKGEEDVAVDIVQSLIASPVWNTPSRQQSYTDVPRIHRLLRLIDVLTSNHIPADFPNRLSTSLLHWWNRMVSVCLPQMIVLGSLDCQSDVLLKQGDLLQTWSRVLTLGRWLQSDLSQMPQFGHLLVGKLLSISPENQNIAAINLSLLTILLEELYSHMADRQQQVEYVVVAYVTFSRLSKPAELDVLNVQLSSACRTLAIEDFTYMLDFVFEALSCRGDLPSEDKAILMRLSSLIAHDAPENTSKTTHDHTTRCLNLFAHCPEYIGRPSLRHEVLSFMSQQLNDRPASVRISDLSSIWSLMGHLLAGSVDHESTTNSNVFHQIVAIISALIRLRRDLVICTLPHLGMVLRQLTASLRGLRPQLGGKQTKLVMNTLPKWINASTPLSAEESKALARLMTTLATKTIVRTHGPSADTQKPESLARPFSKHAAYVLTAYINAVNDPLCVVSTQVRKELQPGLFALCDMLGDHNRDSMMVSALDTGGKAMMKALWREYEKQKYIGKG
ncbi:hypothetical protein AcW1_000407 [Taiwanofungus camphoratus]|nr:hypothetical protein AcW1_000407 [Antrodia cinnamomea]